MRRIEKALAPLASLKVQHRYIIEGTKDEYLVPEEMLNSAFSELSRQQLTPELANVHRALRACDLPADLTATQLVYQYAPWLQLREAARSYLKASGFDLEAWEGNEL
jgi:hypothetical protein